MDFERKLNIKAFNVSSDEGLQNIEKTYRPYYHREDNVEEAVPWAIGTPYVEIASTIIPDRSGTKWTNPVFFIRTWHKQNHSIRELCNAASNYLRARKEKGEDFDILSLQSAIDDGNVVLNILVRSYDDKDFDFRGFFDYIGEDIENKESEVDELAVSGELVIPDEIRDKIPTKEDQIKYKSSEEYKHQDDVLKNASPEHPFLNSISEYMPREIRNPMDYIDPIYDMRSAEQNIATVTKYEDFDRVFKEIMRYVNGVEQMHYFNVIKGDEREDTFLGFIKDYIITEYVNPGILKIEDVPLLLKKLNKALFQLYIIQDMIDNPDITDINITGPDAIRVRIKGDTYLSNVTFVDEDDYNRFIEVLYIRNDLLRSAPSQTFTDKRDDNYILRFTVSAAYVNSNPWAYLHIRKIARKKLLGDDLVRLGFMTDKVKNYLLDCAKTSRGVVFAGAPGSGKTVGLNWFLEEGYEHSADILVIQENDELFAYRKGIKFQHVVNYTSDNGRPIDLEELGRLALVAGANVFIIGEAKGGEICSAITLSNSGCRTAITIHSPSSTETIDKMADLAMRGYAQNQEQAMRMLKSFQTVVYLEKFGISEISEITGYNEEKHCIEYRCIYRRDLDPEAPVRK